MQRSTLRFDKSSDGSYHAVFRNKHSRRIYIGISVDNDVVTLLDCFYVDRPPKDGHYPVPQLFKTRKCNMDELTDVIANELDKQFYGVELHDSDTQLDTKSYIKQRLSDRRKYRLLVLIGQSDNGELPDVLETRIKNRVHRSIYLKLRRSDNGYGIVEKCHYYDRKYKRNRAYITPQGLISIFFEYNLGSILNIVNLELNCDFTDAIVTNDTIGFTETDIPVCGNV